jgi:hypothetical protein
MRYILTLEKYDELSHKNNSFAIPPGTELSYGDTVKSLKSVPLNYTLYHGSNRKFDHFDLSKIGRQTDPGWYSKGIYFTKNQSLAAYYGIYIYECEISLSNPFYCKASDKHKFKRQIGLSDDSTPEDATEYLISKGFDGVVILNPINSQIDECVVYDPKNIKIKSIIDI